MNTNLKYHLSYKINGYKKFDEKLKIKYPDENINLKTITTNEALIFIKEKNIKNCPICEDIILYDNYSSHCLFQFSFDRINNKEIHHLNNIQITCYNCNSKKANAEINNNRYKIWGYACKNDCINKCHLIDKDKNEEIKNNCPKEFKQNGKRHNNLEIIIN